MEPMLTDHVGAADLAGVARRRLDSYNAVHCDCPKVRS
jgi:hypothetical protein